MEIIKGKIIVLGDDVDTDQILPGYAMAEPYDKLGGFAMAGLAGLDFNAVYEPGSILVAGRNFGCGSSREQAPIALKQRGVSLIMAKGFARIFRRNSINIGLPVIVCKDLYDHIEDGDQMELSLTDGIASVNGQEFVCTKLPPYMQNILDQGGLIASLNKEED